VEFDHEPSRKERVGIYQKYNYRNSAPRYAICERIRKIVRDKCSKNDITGHTMRYCRNKIMTTRAYARGMKLKTSSLSWKLNAFGTYRKSFANKRRNTHRYAFQSKAHSARSLFDEKARGMKTGVVRFARSKIYYASFFR